MIPAWHKAHNTRKAFKCKFTHPQLFPRGFEIKAMENEIGLSILWGLGWALQQKQPTNTLNYQGIWLFDENL